MTDYEVNKLKTIIKAMTPEELGVVIDTLEEMYIEKQNKLAEAIKESEVQ